MSNVGQAITGIAGGTAGFFIGGPSGALMGFGLGLTIGGILFPPSVEVEQPRPMNLQVQTSQVGLAIPVVYGSRKVAGNLIWYGDFQSHAQTQEVGGGSMGGSQTVTTGYTYSVSMAWGLTLVKPGTTKGVVRCWAGKNLVDPSQYRVYDGSQTEPDSYIASKVTTTQPTSTSISDGEHAVTSGYTIEGVGVDTQLQTCIVTLTTTAIGTDASVDVKIQESDDGSAYADWSGGGFSGVSSVTTGSRQYTGGKQYIRAVAQVNTAACSFGVTVMVIDPAGSRAPTWKNLCYVVMENFNLGGSPYIPQFTWELAIENSGFYRLDENSEGLISDTTSGVFGTEVYYNSYLDKVVTLSIHTYAGNKNLCGIYLCNPTNLEIVSQYTTTTTPGYSELFSGNNCWLDGSKVRNDPTSKWIMVVSVGSATIMMLNGETGDTKYLQFFYDQESLGFPYNVSGTEIYNYPLLPPEVVYPSLASAQYDKSSGRIYIWLGGGYFYAPIRVFGYVDFDGTDDSYTFNALFQLGSVNPWELVTFFDMLYIPEMNYVALTYKTLNGSGVLLVIDCSNGDTVLWLNSEVEYNYPASGITSRLYYADGGIWGGFTYDPIYVGQFTPEMKGLMRVDITQDRLGQITFSSTPDFADDTDYSFWYIVPYGNSLLIGSQKYGICIYNPITYEWKNYDNANTPGLDPTDFPSDDFPTVATNGGTIYAGSFLESLYGWSGVVMLGGYNAGDVNPDDVVIDILTNDLYGAALSNDLLDLVKCAATWQYCQDNDLLVSLAFGTQSSILDALSYVLQHHNGFISYYDGKIAHEQFQFITPTETLSDANNDFVEDTDYPINISKAGERDYYNRVQIEYTKRAGEYAEGIALADDMVDIDTYRLKDITIKIDGLCTYSRAEKMAWVYLKKSLFQPQHLTIKLGPKSKTKTLPGAMVGITDTKTELNNLPIRFLTISEGTNGTLDVEALEENAAIYDFDMSSSAETPLVPGTDVNPRDPAESVVHPNGFVIDSYIYPDSRVAIVVYSQPPDNPSWMGASVYRAYAAGGPYERLMTNSGSGVIGIVSEVGTDSGGNSYIDLELDTDATLASIADADFDTNIYRNMFYARGRGYGRFKTATLTGTNTWRLTDIYWYTETIISANSYGDVIANDMLDFFAGTLNIINLKSFETGITLYIKTPSFNMIGVEQSLADIPYFTIVIPGAASSYLMTEDGNNLITEDGNKIIT